MCLTAVVSVACAYVWATSVGPLSGPRVPGVPYSLGECRPATPGAEFGGEPLLVGADVGASARLADGRVVWAYGDTFRRPDGVTLTAVRNSLAIQSDDCRAVVIPAGGQEAIPNRADGVGYWPMSLAVTHEGRTSRLRVFAERVRGSEGGFRFVNLGPAVATFVVSGDGAPILQSVTDLGPDDASRVNVGWGAAVADGGDGYWYVYGTANPDQPMVFGWSVRVARSTAVNLDNPSAWEYWSGGVWSRDASRATPLIDAVGGVSQTFSVFRAGASWYAVSKRDGDLGADLAVWAASAPWGPFGHPVTVGRIPDQDEPSVLRYMPLAHPEVPSSPGTVLVSVCRNSADPELLARSPELYRPFFVEVAIPPVPSTRVMAGPG